MFRIPTAGIARSISGHNSNLQVCSDWIEYSVILSKNAVSKTDIVDILIEEQIYDDQDFANTWVESCFDEIRRRNKWIGTSSPFSIKQNRIEPVCDWQDVPAYVFCLFLSLTPHYPDIGNSKGKTKTGHNEQGELFELMTLESLQKQFTDWRFLKTGWSRSKTAKIKTIVQEVAQLLGERQGQLEPWVSTDAADAGLDLLCYRPFGDGRVGIPVYLLQCASGANWTTKTKTPDIDIWMRMITFAATPKRAFATPFALEEREFSRASAQVQGLLLDRYRLIVPDSGDKLWLSNGTASSLEKWLKPRMKLVPKY